MAVFSVTLREFNLVNLGGLSFTSSRVNRIVAVLKKIKNMNIEIEILKNICNLVSEALSLVGQKQRQICNILYVFDVTPQSTILIKCYPLNVIELIKQSQL